MPFGRKSELALVHQAVKLTLSSFERQLVSLCLVDIILHSKLITEHLGQAHSTTSATSKCRADTEVIEILFLQLWASCLGYANLEESLTVDMKSCKASYMPMLSENDPKSRNFIRMCSEFRCFRHVFAQSSAPISLRTGRRQPFEFKPGAAAHNAY